MIMTGEGETQHKNPIIDETPWITAIKNNDLSVFGAIYETYGDEIFRFVQRKCGSRTLAEDLTSDVFYKAFKNIRHCCRAANPNIRARIYVIARNRVIDEFKRSKSTLLNDAIPLEDTSVDHPIDTANTSLLTDYVLNYLKTLGDDIYDLFIMRFWQQLSYQEIAAINGKSVDNNKKIFSRTVQKIHDRFSTFLSTHA